jgi:type II secretory pathway pseudopilin PulG
MKKECTQKGITLVELMISLGILSVLTLGIGTFITNQQKVAESLKYAVQMRSIAHRIEQSISKPETLRSSATWSNYTGNLKLKGCISSRTKGTALLEDVSRCTTTNPKEQQDFELITPLGNVTESIKKKVLHEKTLAGSSKNPARYRLRDGTKCSDKNTTATGDCQLEARSYFWATCPPKSSFLDLEKTTNSTIGFTPTNCPTAQTIHVRYQLIHNFHGSKNSKTGKILDIDRQIPSIPSDEIFWEDSSKKNMSSFSAISIAVSTIPRENDVFNYSCPPNYTITGIVDGAPTCECLYPYHEVGEIKKICIAHEEKCGPSERYRGTDVNGKIVCQPVSCTDNIPLENGCGEGGWIEGISPLLQETKFDPAWRNACWSTLCNIAKDGGACDRESRVECFMRIRCCYETSNKR